MVAKVLGDSPFAALTAFTIGKIKPIIPTNKKPSNPRPNSNIAGTLIANIKSIVN